MSVSTVALSAFNPQFLLQTHNLKYGLFQNTWRKTLGFHYQEEIFHKLFPKFYWWRQLLLLPGEPRPLIARPYFMAPGCQNKKYHLNQISPGTIYTNWLQYAFYHCFLHCYILCCHWLIRNHGLPKSKIFFSSKKHSDCGAFYGISTPCSLILSFQVLLLI